MKTKIKFFIPLFFFLTTLSRAQLSTDSLSFGRQSFGVPSVLSLFDKQLNTYSSKTKFNFRGGGKKVFWGVSENYQTTLIKSSVNHLKDENNFKALGELIFSPFLSTGILLGSNVYSDDRKLSINNTAVHNASLFTRFSAGDIFSIIPYGGYSFNSQIGEKDKGFVYGGEMRINKFNFAYSQIFLKAKYHNEDILPRRNLIREISGKLKNNLNDYSQNLFFVSYNKQRKDFYFGTDSLTRSTFGITNNIQSRTETKYLLSDQFKFRDPSSNWLFNFGGYIFWRNIDRSTRYILKENINSSSFDSDIEELKLNLGSAVTYNSRSLSGFLKMNYSERNETHRAKRIEGANPIFFDEREELEKQKNNHSQLVTIYSSLNYSITSKDKILFNLLHRKLRYDTPSEKNYDDRDELLTLFNLRYERKFFPFFNYFLEFEGSINHIVYIFAQRSSNNNIQRVLKLSSGGEYVTRILKWITSAEVSANYTVYDFEDINPNIKSFVFRQFVLRDSTELRITTPTYFKVNGYIKLSEQGDFKWSDFKSRPSRYVEEVYVVPEFVYRWRKMIFGSGIRYFSLTTFHFNNDFALVRFKSYKSIGPLSEIRIELKSLMFSLYGWYEHVIYEDNSTRELVNLKINARWNF